VVEDAADGEGVGQRARIGLEQPTLIPDTIRVLAVEQRAVLSGVGATRAGTSSS
jgi:hypothetical protein